MFRFQQKKALNNKFTRIIIHEVPKREGSLERRLAGTPDGKRVNQREFMCWNHRVYSSAVEQSAAVRSVPGSIPGGPYIFFPQSFQKHTHPKNFNFGYWKPTP